MNTILNSDGNQPKNPGRSEQSTNPLAPNLIPVKKECALEGDVLRGALLLLQDRTGHDLSRCDGATLLRGIERRRQIRRLSDLPGYLALLRQDKEESTALLDELRPPSHRVFPGGEVFSVMEREVVPRLFQAKTARDWVRVWVVNCGSGEEAYSATMLLSEQADLIPHAPGIQVFGTAAEKDQIVKARNGDYPELIAGEVEPAWLRAFFTRTAVGYRIKQSIRERTLFTVHDLLDDPPFSRLDLVYCRNLPGDVDSGMQERALQLFHRSLCPNGFLVLGGLDAANLAPTLFIPFNGKAGVFQRKETARLFAQESGLALSGPFSRKALGDDDGGGANEGLLGELHRRLLEQHATSSVLINREYEIVHLSGQVGRYLQFAGGEPSYNLLKLVIPDLRYDLRAALFQAARTGQSTESRRVRVGNYEQGFFVRMTVRPASELASGGELLFVQFNEIEDTIGVERTGQQINDILPVVQYLEEELKLNQNQLREAIGQREVLIEGLRASNEELRHLNEEFRQANEDLEAREEQLRVGNDRLFSAYQELTGKIGEISNVNDYLQNLIVSTDIATIFLDQGLHIKRYTPRALDIFNLVPADVGCSVRDVPTILNYDHLVEDATSVFSSLRSLEREVQSRDGHWYIARLLPYRTLEDRIGGVVLTFLDISGRKAAEEALLASEAELRRSRDLLESQVKERTRELERSKEALESEVMERRAAESQINALLRQIVNTQENERKRISRELHDHLGQRLTALRLSLEALREHSRGQGHLNEHVAGLQLLAKQLDTDVDYLAWELRPRVIDDTGLVTAVANYVEEWSRLSAIHVEFHTTGLDTNRLSPEIETSIYRITQEALNNISKHARATRVDVIFEQHNDHVVLIIEDNGIGFDPEPEAVAEIAGSGLGLLGMRERAALVGGIVEIESGPGNGTTIFVRAPITPSEPRR